MFLTQIVLINLNLVAQIIAVKDFIVCLIWTDFRCFFCNLANLRFIIATNISYDKVSSRNMPSNVNLQLAVSHVRVYEMRDGGSNYVLIKKI